MATYWDPNVPLQREDADALRLHDQAVREENKVEGGSIQRLEPPMYSGKLEDIEQWATTFTCYIGLHFPAMARVLRQTAHILPILELHDVAMRTLREYHDIHDGDVSVGFVYTMVESYIKGGSAILWHTFNYR